MELRALAVKSAPDTYVVVGAGNATRDKVHEMKVCGDGIRRGSAARHVAPRARWGMVQQTGEQVESQKCQFEYPSGWGCVT